MSRMRSGCGALLLERGSRSPGASLAWRPRRASFHTSIPCEDITSSERQCWLLQRLGLSLEFLVEVLRIDVQLLLGRLLRPGGGLGDLACQAGFDEPDSFCLSCSPAHRVTIPYSHVATGYGHIHVWSADQQDLHRISVAEDAVESYIPSGIDVGIDFGKVETPCTPAKVMAAPLRELEGLQHRLGVGRASCSALTTGNQ